MATTEEPAAHLYYRLRLGEADRARYPDLPEWVEYHPDAVCDLPFDEAVRIEDTIGMSITQLHVVNMPAYTARGARAAYWIGARLAGHDIAWPAFKPAPQRMDWLPVYPPARAGGGDADPPARRGRGRSVTAPPASS